MSGTLYPSPKILGLRFSLRSPSGQKEQAINSMHLSLASCCVHSPILIRYGPEIMCLRGSAGLIIRYSCLLVFEPGV